MAGTIRCFIAVDIPDLAKRAIASALDPLRESMRDVKWVEPANLHLTLKFLGNIKSSQIDHLIDILSGSLKNEERFLMNFSDLGAFPNPKNPKIFWMGVDKGQTRLRALAEKVEAACTLESFEKETKPFSAHLTLGRVREGRKTPPLDRSLELFHLDLETPIEVDHVELYESVLRPEGPQYRSLSRFSLR